MTAKPKGGGGSKTKGSAAQAREAREKPKTSNRSGALPWLQHGELVVALALVAVAGALHLVVLFNAGGLWRDEANTARFATMPALAESFAKLEFDSFPLGTTVLFRLWSFVSTTDTGWRIAGFLVGIGIIASFWAAGRLFGFGVPILSLALVGFNGVAVRYGDSIRPYGLGTLFAVITLGLFWKAATTGGYRYRIAATIAAIISVQCLYQNAFLILAAGAAGVAVAARRRDWKAAGFVIGAGLIAAISVTPYVRFIRAAEDWSMIVRSDLSAGNLWPTLSAALSSSFSLMTGLWIGLWLLALALAIAALTTWKEAVADDEKEKLLFAAIALLGALAYLGFFKVANLATQTWYYLPLMAFSAVSIDTVFSALVSKSFVKQLRVVLAALMALAALPVLWSEAHMRATNVDLIAAKIAAEAAKDDLIVVNPFFIGVSFTHAYRGETPVISVPAIDDLSIHRYDLVKKQMAQQNPTASLLDAIQRTLGSGKKVWWIGNIALPQQGQQPPSLPPAPNGPHGWFYEDYSDAWTLQLSHFMRIHGAEPTLIDVNGKAKIADYERVSFRVFSGWKRLE